MGKKEGGRPNEFKESYIQAVDEYLQICTDEEVQRIKTDGTKSITYEFGIKVKLPSIEGFADFIGVARSSIYEWEKAHDEFKIALDKIRSVQKQRLINNGLAGVYSPVITKLILSSDHGMRERIDATTGDEPMNPFSDEQVDRIANRITSRKRGNGGESGPKKPN
jgi:hypothetical protein